MVLNKLEKIFAVGMLATASFATAGLITKNELMSYIGSGAFITSTCGAILSSKPKKSDYGPQDSNNSNKYEDLEK